jgi:hypothetical protein
VVHADKLIEKARQAVDVNLSRRAWRAFHTLRGSEPEAKRCQFRPAQWFRFAVIRPIGADTLKTGTEKAWPRQPGGSHVAANKAALVRRCGGGRRRHASATARNAG